jgi:hypothetical protein
LEEECTNGLPKGTGDGVPVGAKEVEGWQKPANKFQLEPLENGLELIHSLLFAFSQNLQAPNSNQPRI